MLVRQIRITRVSAILFSGGIFAGLLADWINHPLQYSIGLKQQSLILICAAIAFLLWDCFFLLKRSINPVCDEHSSLSYLFFSFSGLGLIFAALFIPAFFPKDLWDALSNSLKVLGLFLLLVGAYVRFNNLGQRNKFWDTLWLIELSTLIYFFSNGLFNYLSLSLISLYAGRGILSLINIPRLNEKSLAPFITLAFWSVLLGFGVGLGIPIKYISLAIWPLTIWLVWRGSRNSDFRIRFDRTDILVFALPLAVAFPYTLFGFSLYAGNPSQDGWNYIAYGEFLWQSSRCVAGNLTPMYRWSAALACNSRYISASLLSLFSFITGRIGDTQSSVGIFVPWVFFIYSSSLRLFIENKTPTAVTRIAYLLLGVLAGWPMMVMYLNNFDNLLAIIYLPVLFIITEKTDFSLRWNVLLGFLLAVAGYTYAEMTPLIYLAAGIFVLKRFITDRYNLRSVLSISISMGISMLVFLIPYLPTMKTFLLTQANLRPGEGLFPELVDPTLRWFAFWGMGGKEGSWIPGSLMAATWFDIARMLIAACFFVFFACGFYLLFQKREFALVVINAIFLGAVAYLSFYLQFPYGVYKPLNLFWWLAAYTIVLAFETLIASAHRFRKILYVLGVFGYGVYFLAIAVFAFNLNYLPTHSILPFRQLEDLPVPLNKAIVVVVVDDYANLWANYYLRERDILVDPYGGWMGQHLQQQDPLRLHIQQASLDEIQYLLTESTQSSRFPGEIIWHNSIYTLIKLTDNWAYAVDIQNQNGLEEEKGIHFFWMGMDAVKIRIVSSFDGCGQLSFDTKAGPSLPEHGLHHLSISYENKTSRIPVVSDSIRFSINLKKGTNNLLTMQVLEKPVLSTLSNGDTRTLMLLVSNLSVKKCDSSEINGGN